MKKCLSLVLALVMALGLLTVGGPAASAAGDPVEVDSWADLQNALEGSSSAVKLTTDINFAPESSLQVVDIVLVITGEKTIDLNGYTITLINEDNTLFNNTLAWIRITEGSKLTIINGKIQSRNKNNDDRYGNGTILVEGELNTSNVELLNNGSGAVCTIKKGILNLSGGTIQSLDGYALYSNTTSTTTVSLSDGVVLRTKSATGIPEQGGNRGYGAIYLRTPNGSLEILDAEFLGGVGVSENLIDAFSTSTHEVQYALLKSESYTTATSDFPTSNISMPYWWGTGISHLTGKNPVYIDKLKLTSLITTITPFAFTTQPVSGTAKKTDTYTFSWATNATPDSIFLDRWIPVASEWGSSSSLAGLTSSSESYKDLFADGNVSKYRIQATKGSETIYSNEFTVTWTEDSPTFAFTTQPVSGTAKKTAPYTYSWATNAIPDSIFIDRWIPSASEWGSSSSLTGVTSSSETYKDLFVDGNISKYRIQATKGSDTIYSKEFTVTWTDEATPSTYTITFNPNGGTVSPTTATTGADGRLASFPTPTREGYTFTGWYAWPKDNTEVPKDTVFTEDTTIYAHWKEGAGPLPSSAPTPTPTPHSSFKDVPDGAYFTEAVAWAVDKKITQGTGADTFSPDATCTRGQVVTFLWRAAGSPAPSKTDNPFTDVDKSAYYADAVLWAVEKGITNGAKADTFAPDQGCTRGQVVTFLHRFENTPAASASAPFADVDDSAYYAGAVAWAVEKNVTQGTGTDTFSPDDTCTRGQIVTFLYRDMK